MDAFACCGFGLFLADHFQSCFQKRSWQSFLRLAYGWSVCRYHHTIAQYIWLSGGVEDKHFSRYYDFLSLTFLRVLDHLWGRVFGLLDSMVNATQQIELVIDDTVRKKCGRKIEGASHYRNGAGSARQEYRSLWGLNFVWLSMNWYWGTHRLSLPLGLRVYLKKDLAEKLGRDFASRSELAREMLDFVARHWPHRRLLVLVDGGYATKAFLQNLPAHVDVLGRFPINSKLFGPAPTPPSRTKGRPRTKGDLLGSPKSWREQADNWQEHPNDPNLRLRMVDGYWHSVLPGVNIRVVAIWRDDTQKPKARSKQKPLEAFFTTEINLSDQQILAKYRLRWTVEIAFKDANAFYGLAQDRCRKIDRIFGVNSFRILMAALRTIWVVKQARNASLNLTRFRPWYLPKKQMTQLDIYTLSEELLAQDGILPTIRFLQDMPEIHPSQNSMLSSAA